MSILLVNNAPCLGMEFSNLLFFQFPLAFKGARRSNALRVLEVLGLLVLGRWKNNFQTPKNMLKKEEKIYLLVVFIKWTLFETRLQGTMRRLTWVPQTLRHLDLYLLAFSNN